MGTPHDVEGCVAILASLPEFFTPDTHEAVRAGWAQNGSWVATHDGEVVGFVLVERRHETSAEITYAAVASHRRAAGVGTALVDAARPSWRGTGCRSWR